MAGLERRLPFGEEGVIGFGGLERGLAHFLGCRRCRNHLGVQGRIPLWHGWVDKGGKGAPI